MLIRVDYLAGFPGLIPETVDSIGAVRVLVNSLKIKCHLYFVASGRYARMMPY